jgi:hypothetical protein
MATATLLATRKLKRALIRARKKARTKFARSVIDKKIEVVEERERMNEIGL